jgi:hypothetical protein
MDAVATPILDSGGPPPQQHLLGRISRMDEEQMLLFAAWAHGMTAEDIVHRYTLFAFVQTHLSRKSEEQLQRAVETSADWEGQGAGKYRLRARGLKRITRFFGPCPPRSSLSANYVLRRAWEGHEFAVEISPVSRAIAVFIDGVQVKGVEACQSLENLGATFDTKSTPGTRRVLNWIIQQEGPYNWQRL